MSDPTLPATIDPSVLETVNDLAPMDQVRITFRDGKVAEGEVRLAQGTFMYVETTEHDFLTLSEKINPADLLLISKIEVMQLAHEVFAVRQAKKFGEWAVNPNPQTREEFRIAILTLAQTIQKHADAKPKLGQADYMTHARRSYQLHAQFDELTARVELAKTKRNYLLRYANLYVAGTPERRSKFNPIGTVDVLPMVVPKESDFDPDMKVRRARSPRPAADYHDKAELEYSRDHAKELANQRVPRRLSPERRAKFEAIVAEREKELANGDYFEAKQVEEQKQIASVVTTTMPTATDLPPQKPDAGDYAAWRDRLEVSEQMTDRANNASENNAVDTLRAKWIEVGVEARKHVNDYIHDNKQPSLNIRLGKGAKERHGIEIYTWTWPDGIAGYQLDVSLPNSGLGMRIPGGCESKDSAALTAMVRCRQYLEASLADKSSTSDAKHAAPVVRVLDQKLADLGVTDWKLWLRASAVEVAESVAAATAQSDDLTETVAEPVAVTGTAAPNVPVPVERPSERVPTLLGELTLGEFELNGYAPWLVRRDEWVALQRAERRRLGQNENGDNPNNPNVEYTEYHADEVKRAFADGFDVPAGVLTDYPDLLALHNASFGQMASPAEIHRRCLEATKHFKEVQAQGAASPLGGQLIEPVFGVCSVKDGFLSFLDYEREGVNLHGLSRRVMIEEAALVFAKIQFNKWFRAEGHKNPGERDPHIGRSWNSPYGKQTIRNRVINGGSLDISDPMYEAVNETGQVRRYRGADLDRDIKRQEYEITPEYAKEVAANEELAKLRAESAARQKAIEDKTLAEITAFTDGDTPMLAGKKRAALLKQFRYDGVVMSRKSKIEALVESGEESKVLFFNGADHYMVGGYDMGKTGFEYAQFLAAKKTEAQEEAAARAPSAITPENIESASTKMTPTPSSTTTTEPPLPSEVVQRDITNFMAAAIRIYGPVDGDAYRKAHAALFAAGARIGVAVAPAPVSFYSDTYKKIADDAMLGMAQKYGSFPTRETRDKRDAAIAYMSPAAVTSQPTQAEGESTRPQRKFPLVQEWADLKKVTGDDLLALRVGDFYEFFEDDAKKVAKALNITLTKRGETLMTGVPYHAAESYFKRLKEAGFTLALAEADPLTGKRPTLIKSTTPAPPVEAALPTASPVPTSMPAPTTAEREAVEDKMVNAWLAYSRAIEQHAMPSPVTKPVPRFMKQPDGTEGWNNAIIGTHYGSFAILRVPKQIGSDDMVYRITHTPSGRNLGVDFVKKQDAVFMVRAFTHGLHDMDGVADNPEIGANGNAVARLGSIVRAVRGHHCPEWFVDAPAFDAPVTVAQPTAAPSTAAVDDRGVVIKVDWDKMLTSAQQTVRTWVNAGILYGKEVPAAGGRGLLLITKPLAADLEPLAAEGETALFRITSLTDQHEPTGHYAVSRSEWDAWSKDHSQLRATQLGSLFEAAQFSIRPDLVQGIEGVLLGTPTEYFYRLRNRPVAIGTAPKGYLRADDREVVYDHPLTSSELYDYEINPVGAKILVPVAAPVVVATTSTAIATSMPSATVVDGPADESTVDQSPSSPYPQRPLAAIPADVVVPPADMTALQREDTYTRKGTMPAVKISRQQWIEDVLASGFTDFERRKFGRAPERLRMNHVSRFDSKSRPLFYEALHPAEIRYAEMRRQVIMSKANEVKEAVVTVMTDTNSVNDAALPSAPSCGSAATALVA